MRRLRKGFSRPKRPYDVDEITGGKEKLKKYGLRRKKEIWIAKERVREFRQRARKLIAESDSEAEKVLVDKLAKLGLLPRGAHLDDVLGLTEDTLLDRRLQSLVHSKGLTKTPKQARQAIVHGHVTIGDRKVTFPSYIVAVEEEATISSSFTPPEPSEGKGQIAPAPQEPGEEGADPQETSTEEPQEDAAAPAENKEPGQEEKTEGKEKEEGGV